MKYAIASVGEPIAPIGVCYGDDRQCDAYLYVELSGGKRVRIVRLISEGEIVIQTLNESDRTALEALGFRIKNEKIKVRDPRNP